MVWTIKQVDGQYQVTDDAGKVVGIHLLLPDAEAHLYSLYAGVTVRSLAEDAEIVQRTPTTCLKMIGDDQVGGYLVVWGSPQQRDLYGEYFTPETDLGLDWYDQRPALYHHGLDGTMKTAVIGRITSLKADDTGVWAEAQLDMRSRYVQKIREMVQKGVLGWSSGSLAHLVEVTDDGWIKRWPIVEGSATPTPAEPRHTQINSLKFGAYKAAVTGLSDEPPEVAAGDEGAENPVEDTVNDDAPQTDDEHETSEDTHMDNEMIMQIIAATAELMGVEITPEQAQQIMDTVMPQAEAAIEAVQVDATPEGFGKALAGNVNFTTALKSAISRTAANGSPDAVAAAFKATAAARPGQSRTTPAHQPMSANPPAPQAAPQITVKSEYDALDVSDMLYGYMMMKHRKGGFQGVSEPYANAMADKVTRAGKSAIKANELSHSTQSSYGDEWVPDLWSSELWNKVRLENKILPLFQAVDMPSNPYELPIEGTDPTVYYVPETTAEAELLISGSGAVIPDSKIGTGKVQLAAKKLALRVGFSAELVEDSIVPVLSIYRRQAERAIMDSIDHLLLNGDTESGATGNINSDDGAPAATAKYMAFNGLLKAALVTDTTRKYDAGGAAPTLSAVRTARWKMGAAYAADVRNLAYIVGSDVYAKLLGLDEFLTMDKIGNDATALTGQIGMMDGVPVILSAELAQAEADGKINTASPSSTLFGRLVAVHRGTWYAGYRRRIALDVSYLPYYDSYQLTATVRLAFVNQNTQGIAVAYDFGS